MSFLQLVKIEFIKLRRGKILLLLFAAPLLVTVSGVANLRRYLAPEYTNAWAAMFIQSALVYAYYLLPLSMAVVCAVLAGRERASGGLRKMLTLPLSPRALSAAKMCVLLCFLAAELAAFLLTFSLAGTLAVRSAGVAEALPLNYLLQWCGGLFLTMLPCAAAMWAVTALCAKPLPAAGINLLLVLPSVLLSATPLWFAYPYCYSGRLVSAALHDFTASAASAGFELFPFLPTAALALSLAALLAVEEYGKRGAAS
ncbi:MAG: ABC transporter permease [Oscillospiraceae bacterium]|nr:ABC transporter permease [Oscillospiraceae bacterium]